MARALHAWALNRGGKNSVRNLRYGPRTRLVRGSHNINRKRSDISNPSQEVNCKLSNWHSFSTKKVILDVDELTYERWRTDIRGWRNDFICWWSANWLACVTERHKYSLGFRDKSSCSAGYERDTLAKKTGISLSLAVIRGHSWSPVVTRRHSCLQINALSFTSG